MCAVDGTGISVYRVCTMSNSWLFLKLQQNDCIVKPLSRKQVQNISHGIYLTFSPNICLNFLFTWKLRVLDVQMAGLSVYTPCSWVSLVVPAFHLLPLCANSSYALHGFILNSQALENLKVTFNQREHRSGRRLHRSCFIQVVGNSLLGSYGSLVGWSLGAQEHAPPHDFALLLLLSSHSSLSLLGSAPTKLIWISGSALETFITR